MFSNIFHLVTKEKSTSTVVECVLKEIRQICCKTSSFQSLLCQLFFSFQNDTLMIANKYDGIKYLTDQPHNIPLLKYF